MADVVIRGIEMPKGDLEYVSLWVYGDGRVYVSNKASAASSRRLPDLAVPLPEGHGELVDKTEAYDRIAEQEGGNYIDMDSVGKGLEECQTIVPAEGGGEE